MATCCRSQHFCPNCRPCAGLFTPRSTKIASPDLLETRRPRPFWQFRDRNYLAYLASLHIDFPRPEYRFVPFTYSGLLFKIKNLINEIVD